MTTRAGWYADPSNPQVSLRYHDGQEWTRHVTHQVNEVPPAAPEAPVLADEEYEEGTPVGRRRLVVIVLVVLLLLGGLGGGFYWYAQGDAPSDGIPQLDTTALNAPAMPQDPPVGVSSPAAALPADVPVAAPSIPAAPAPGATRLEFATSAGAACTKAADTIAAFDLASLDDQAQSPGRFPRAVGEAYTALAVEVAALPAPDADKLAINNGLIGPAAAIGSDATALADEVDRIFAESGYIPAAETTSAIELISAGSAAQAMSRFTEEYGISCGATS